MQNYSIDIKRYKKIISTLAEKHLEQALTHAGACGHDAILIDLMDMDKDAIKKLGKTALQGAVMFDHPICVDYLIKAGVEVTDNLLLLAAADRYASDLKPRGTKTLQLLLEAGVNLHVRASYGHWSSDSEFTPFLLACSYDNIPILNMLIDAGANLKDVGIEGPGMFESYIHAYHVASRGNYREKLDVLCQAKERQVKLFCYQLLNALPHDEKKVITKWRAAGLNQVDLVEYLSSTKFPNPNQQIDILKLAIARNANDAPMNPLSQYLKSYFNALKIKLHECENVLEIQYGSHRGTLNTMRPYLPAYGPQNPKHITRFTIVGSALRQYI
ncbi:MAG: hypothetical protein WC748_03310 [Legionellales bacterium]|jgi:hypothetical protein